MSEKRVPPILYRYFSFGSFIEKVLSGESLRFQNPLAFNDPFDGRPSVYIDMDDQMTIDYWHSVGKKFHMGRAQRRRKIKEMKERVKKEGNERCTHARRSAKECQSLRRALFDTTPG